MPYDASKSRPLLQVARAYSNSPMGEYIGPLATQLIDAEAEIKDANTRASAAQTALARAEQDRDSALETARKLREGTAGAKDAIAALQSIALNPKGASKLAKDTLVKIGAA